MNKFQKKFATSATMACLLIALFVSPTFVKAQTGTTASPSTSDQSVPETTKKKKRKSKKDAAESTGASTTGATDTTTTETKSPKRHKKSSDAMTSAPAASAAPSSAPATSAAPMSTPTASTPAPTPTPMASSPAPAKKSAAKGGTASSPEIAAAQSSGKVWVNLDSGVYHKGGRWYGKTKNGKFMTEPEAKQAGYRVAEKE